MEIQKRLSLSTWIVWSFAQPQKWPYQDQRIHPCHISELCLSLGFLSDHPTSKHYQEDHHRNKQYNWHCLVDSSWGIQWDFQHDVTPEIKKHESPSHCLRYLSEVFVVSCHPQWNKTMRANLSCSIASCLVLKVFTNGN